MLKAKTRCSLVTTHVQIMRWQRTCSGKKLPLSCRKLRLVLGLLVLGLLVVIVTLHYTSRSRASLPPAAPGRRERPMEDKAFVDVMQIWRGGQVVQTGTGSSGEQDTENGTYPEQGEGAKTPPTPAAAPRFSHHHCVGGEGFSDQWNSRTCRLTNVCYGPSAQGDLLPAQAKSRNRTGFIFYVDPDDGQLEFFERGDLREQGKYTSSPEHWVNLRPRRRNVSPALWSPILRSGPIPAGLAVHPAPLSILYSPYWPLNYGHFVADELFSLFIMMNIFADVKDMNTDVLLIREKDCAMLFGHSWGRAPCEKFSSQLLPSLSRHPVRTLPLLASEGKVDMGDMDEGTTICFRSLLVGQGPLGFSGDGPTWRSFRTFALTNLGYDPTVKPRSHSILILTKSFKAGTVVSTTKASGGRRGIVNLEKLTRSVSLTYPDIPVTVLDPSKVTILEQISAVLRATVLVSPCGGIGFNAPFLSPGTSAIFVNFFDPFAADVHAHVAKDRIKGRVGGGQAAHLGPDASLWTRLGWVHDLYYEVTEHEVELDPAYAQIDVVKTWLAKEADGANSWKGLASINDKEKDQIISAYKHHVSIRVDVERFLGILQRALRHSSRELELPMPAPVVSWH